MRFLCVYRAEERTSPPPEEEVELNRAVAVGMADGPEAGLERLEALTNEPALQRYPFLPAARGAMLAKLGRVEEARAEFARAASLSNNTRERAQLQVRAKA